MPHEHRTLGWLADSGTQIRVLCTGCRGLKDLDLVELAERLGRDYTLYDRRCRCRLTPGCTGWNRFYYMLGVYRGLWSQEAAQRWFLGR